MVSTAAFGIRDKLGFMLEVYFWSLVSSKEGAEILKVVHFLVLKPGETPIIWGSWPVACHQHFFLIFISAKHTYYKHQI